MSKVSVIIPSRNERFMQKTIKDVLAKARGDIEVLAVLDGYWPDPPLEDDPRLVTLHFTQGRGMRGAINGAASVAKGEYLMKCDGHCLFDEGFDEALKADCEEDWVVIPRRYSLDAENWCIANTGKAAVDYHYLSFPCRPDRDYGIHGEPWTQRARERLDILVDDEMSSQGSCWFMKKDYFWRFNGLPFEGYGDFVQEFQQIGMRAWLSGGRVVINKKTFYAHLHKGKTYGRGYYISQPKMIKGTRWSTQYWMNNRWPDRKYDMEWLLDKFAPVPTWPGDWKEIWEREGGNNEEA